MPVIDFTNRKSEEERSKLPMPSNESLSRLFAGVNKVVIKDNGVYDNKAMSDKILLTLSEIDLIHKFHEFFAIDEVNTGFYCMCLGTYAIELYADTQIMATIGFHHGVSIRYHQWDSDAELARVDELLDFLAQQGFTEPLEQRIKDKKEREAESIARRKWLDIAPKCFKKHWNEINFGIDNSILLSLIYDLNLEIPDRQKQIIVLLQTYGKTENFWTRYPVYEELPYNILITFETEEIITAYINSDKNYKTRKGLGRFLCTYEFKKIRKKQLKHIPEEVIADLEKCFDWLGEKRGINEIFSLRNEKNKSLN